jgi:dienelactone hydrolase
MPRHYADLGSSSGLADLARHNGPLFGSDAPAGPEVSRRLRETLGVWAPPADPDVRVADTWTADGVDGTVLTWDVGFGARTEGWLLRPAGATGPLPGAVALHCHGGQKRYGKEKIADGPGGPVPATLAFREQGYGGVAFANELARRGYAVLAHDVFGWGSRRAPITDMPLRSEHVARLLLEQAERDGLVLDEAATYDLHAGPHEDAMAKTLGVLGTSWGGIVAREDLIAVDLLASRADVHDGGVAVVGLSGGGARAALATALSANVRAAVVASMMTTLDAALDGYLHAHTWMMMNPGIGRVADWPDVAAAARPRPLFVGYAERDRLFPLEGMRAAHEILTRRYAEAGSPGNYTGMFVDAQHSFDLTMQAAAWRFLDGQMRVT